MNETKFAVSRFENCNGVTSWRVAGWLHGVRIRKNFLTKEAPQMAAIWKMVQKLASGNNVSR